MKIEHPLQILRLGRKLSKKTGRGVWVQTNKGTWGIRFAARKGAKVIAIISGEDVIRFSGRY